MLCMLFSLPCYIPPLCAHRLRASATHDAEAPTSMPQTDILITLLLLGIVLDFQW